MKKSIVASLLLGFFLLLMIILNSAAMAIKRDASNESLSNYTKLSSASSQTSNRSRLLKQHTFQSFSYNLPIYHHENRVLLKLSFGTPPQALYFIFDTGSDLTWFPCDSVKTKETQEIMTFDPASSSSSRVVGCDHPKTRWFRGQKLKQRCENCKANNPKNCLKSVRYGNSYVQGSTTGFLLSETLNISGHTIEDFIVGCSQNNFLPYGIVGFGSKTESFTSQLRIRKFCFCIPSQYPFNIESQKGYLILNGDSHSKGLSYVPFLLKPSDSLYIVLTEIIIGHEQIKVPDDLLRPGSSGYGGTVVDTGTTFTVMEDSIFEMVTREYQKQIQMGRYITEGENTMFCFDISSKEASTLPKFEFRFENSVTMKLPPQNYHYRTNEYGERCLSIMKSSTHQRRPSIILGNTQLRDFHLEFDLKKKRLGFQEKACS